MNNGDSGGASKCPGESGTSRRESGVTLLEIVPRCGPNRQSECLAVNNHLIHCYS